MSRRGARRRQPGADVTQALEAISRRDVPIVEFSRDADTRHYR
jgi:hypothetical protein